MMATNGVVFQMSAIISEMMAGVDVPRKPAAGTGRWREVAMYSATP